MTVSLAPSKDRAAPYLPVVDHDAPSTVPLFAAADRSATVPPLPSSNDHAPTRPGGGGGPVLPTVTDTGAEVVVFPAASRATALTVCTPLGAAAEFQVSP